MTQNNYRYNSVILSRIILELGKIWKDGRHIFDSMPDVLKYLVVLIAKSFIVSIVLSLIATPATAIYAMRFGLRVPIEGTSYIQFAIGLLSFLAFLLSVVIVTIVVAIMLQFKLFYRKLEIYAHDFRVSLEIHIPIVLAIVVVLKISADAIMKFERVLNWIIIKLFIYVALVSFICAVAYYILVSSRIISIYDPEYRYYYYSILLAIAAALFSFSVWYAATERPIWMLQGYLTLPLVVVMAISLFSYDTYGSVLRIIRYGGGIQARVQLDGIKYENSNVITGTLLLRSNNFAIMETSNKNLIEIPNGKIELIDITYDADWHTPKFSLRDQSKYIRIE